MFRTVRLKVDILEPKSIIEVRNLIFFYIQVQNPYLKRSRRRGDRSNWGVSSEVS